MRRILLIVIAVILYGSLYPWHFEARHYLSSPLWILLHSWPPALSRYVLWDIAVNVALYMPLGVAGYLAVNGRTSAAARICAPLLLGLLLSASVEMLQLYDAARECSALDVASNVSGAALGIALGALYRRKLERAIARRETAALLHPSGALLLCCCWLGYQLFPMFPVFGRARLAVKFAAMGPLSAISLSGTVMVFAEWLAVACLLEGLLEEKIDGALALLLLVIPARLLIVGRTIAWSDIVGALAAFAVWVAVPRTHIRRAAPFLFTAALIASELAPFHVARSSAFNWVPFRGFFEADWQRALPLFFRKTFWYGSVIWLWCAAGGRLVPVTALAAAGLFLLELAQIYLPGRTPEITDAVLAGIMGVLLWLLRPPSPASGGTKSSPDYLR